MTSGLGGRGDLRRSSPQEKCGCGSQTNNKQTKNLLYDTSPAQSRQDFVDLFILGVTNDLHGMRNGILFHFYFLPL